MSFESLSDICSLFVEPPLLLLLRGAGNIPSKNRWIVLGQIVSIKFYNDFDSQWIFSLRVPSDGGVLARDWRKSSWRKEASLDKPSPCLEKSRETRKSLRNRDKIMFSAERRWRIRCRNERSSVVSLTLWSTSDINCIQAPQLYCIQVEVGEPDFT